MTFNVLFFTDNVKLDFAFSPATAATDPANNLCFGCKKKRRKRKKIHQAEPTGKVKIITSCMKVF